MLTLDQIARQLSGVWSMAAGAPDWRAKLDRDTDSVFDSFYALALSAPMALAASALARRAALRSPDIDPMQAASIPPLSSALLDIVGLAITWAASLALLLAIARRTGQTDKAADIVVGWNWLQPVTIVLGLPSIALAAAGLQAAAVGMALLTLVLSVALYFGFLRRAFDAESGAAIGILVMLVVIEIFVDFLVLAIGQSIYAAP
jgi:hypothetical protein